MFALKRLLESKGHKVVVFSMHHPKNFTSEYSRYFVSYINYDEEVKNINLISGLKVLSRTVYSIEAKRKIEQLIKNEKPDVAHINNIHHHITPSIFYPLKKYKIPMVWTLHDYTIICPNTSFLAHGRICERCKKRRYFWPPIIKCKKDSFLASLMASIETTLHRLMRVNDFVDVFIAPSEFLRNKLIEYGFDRKRIVCVNNFNNIDIMDGDDRTEDYYLYIGRISTEKGIKTLVDAVLKGEVDSGRLKIVGDGPLIDELKQHVKVKNNNGLIEFLGHKSHEEVIKLIKNSKFVILPSEWYENYPFVIIETFACGKPVIGSRTGGIPELIKDTERGLLFKMGDLEDLMATIKYLLINPDIVREMGENARAFVKNMLSGENYYNRLISIYNDLLGKGD